MQRWAGWCNFTASGPQTVRRLRRRMTLGRCCSLRVDRKSTTSIERKTHIWKPNCCHSREGYNKTFFVFVINSFRLQPRGQSRFYWALKSNVVQIAKRKTEKENRWFVETCLISQWVISRLWSWWNDDWLQEQQRPFLCVSVQCFLCLLVPVWFYLRLYLLWGWSVIDSIKQEWAFREVQTKVHLSLFHLFSRNLLDLLFFFKKKKIFTFPVIFSTSIRGCCFFSITLIRQTKTP